MSCATCQKSSWPSTIGGTERPPRLSWPGIEAGNRPATASRDAPSFEALSHDRYSTASFGCLEVFVTIAVDPPMKPTCCSPSHEGIGAIRQSPLVSGATDSMVPGAQTPAVQLRSVPLFISVFHSGVKKWVVSM